MNLSQPETLYRYRSTGSGLAKVLNELNGELFCAFSEVLNDPFDGLARDVEKPGTENLISGARKFVRPIYQKTGVACFSETWRSAPMWAHYGSNYSGVCLGYSVQTLSEQIISFNKKRAAKELKSELVKVNYVNRFPDEFKSQEEAIRTKTEEWLYEKEWRLLTQDNLDVKYGKNRKGNIFPIVRSESPRVITEIMLGHKIDFSERKYFFDLWRMDKSLQVYIVIPEKDGTGLIRENISDETSGSEEKIRFTV